MINNFFSDFRLAHADEFVKQLMEQYIVVANENAYFLLEVELYYYDKNEHPDKSVFGRYREAQEFFFHPYGIDICFKTNKEQTCYGGLLIRSIRNMKGESFCGPLKCHDEILKNIDQFGDKSILTISLAKSKDVRVLKIIKTVRIKGKKDRYDKELYRYISKDFHEEILQRPKNDYYRKIIKKYSCVIDDRLSNGGVINVY